MFAIMLLTLGQLVTRADLSIGTTNTTPSGLTIALAWNPSPDANVAGYYVVYGLTADTCTNQLDAGASTNATVYGLQAGVTYYFVVTAYDDNGLESAPSNEIVYTAQNPPPASPITLQINYNTSAGMNLAFAAPDAGTYQIQATEDFQTWQPLWTTNAAAAGPITFMVADSANYPHRFYRMVKD
jgi:fibronectin type 3 domain-containing protein